MNQRFERYFSAVGMITTVVSLLAIVSVGLLVYYRHAPVTHQILGYIGLDSMVPRESIFSDLGFEYADSPQKNTATVASSSVCGCPYCVCK